MKKKLFIILLMFTLTFNTNVFAKSNNPNELTKDQLKQMKIEKANTHIFSKIVEQQHIPQKKSVMTNELAAETASTATENMWYANNYCQIDNNFPFPDKGRVVAKSWTSSVNYPIDYIGAQASTIINDGATSAYNAGHQYDYYIIEVYAIAEWYFINKVHGQTAHSFEDAGYVSWYPVLSAGPIYN